MVVESTGPARVLWCAVAETGTVEVDYAVVAGTAGEADFAAGSGTLTFAVARA